MSEEHVQLLLGAYVLSALEPADVTRVEQHLARCTVCATEHEELHGVAGMLAQLTAADVEGLLAPREAPGRGDFEDLYVRTRSAAEGAVPVREGGARRREGARPGRRAVLAASAAALLLGAAVGVGIRSVRGAGPTTASFSATSAGVHMGIDLTAARTGTTFAATVDGLPRNERCTLVAIAGDGTRHRVSQWVATYDGNAQVTGSTEVPVGSLRHFVLLDGRGRVLVDVKV